MPDHFIQLHSGKKFYFDGARWFVHDIEDIAHALAHLCRFTGHTDQFYSVAQHCWQASHLIEPTQALGALLHDAGEAYTGDVSSPLKRWVSSKVAPTAEFERPWTPLDHLQHATHHSIEAQFNVKLYTDELKYIDRVLLVTEAKLLMPDVSVFAESLDTQPGQFHAWDGCWGPNTAKDAFLKRFYELTAVT